MRLDAKQVVAGFCIIAFMSTTSLARGAGVEGLFGVSDASLLSKPSEYVFRSYPGQNLISVNLVGSISKPGLYHIPEKTDLITLLSIAGGLSSDADKEGIVIRRAAEPRIPPVQVDIEKLIESAQFRGPTLGANDVIFVKKQKSWFNSNVVRGLTLVSVIAGLVLTSIVITEKVKD